MKCVLLLLVLMSRALVDCLPFRDHPRTLSSSPRRSETHLSLDRPRPNKAFAPLEHAQHLPTSSQALPAPVRTNADASDSASVVQIWTQLYVSEWGVQTWTGNISIGTPPQPFAMAFASYWSDSWVIDVSCDGSDFEMCNGTRHEFNSTASSTYATTDESFSDDFYDEYYPALTGSMGTDTFRVGTGDSSGQQLVITGAEFAQINDFGDDANTGQWDNFAFDGVLGLGTDSMSYSGDATILEQAVSQGSIPANTYTVYLPVSSPTTMLYTLGGLDSVNCGSVPEWISTTNSNLEFTIDSVHMGSVSVTNDTSSVHVFPDSPLLMGDTAKINRIVAAAGAESNAQLGIYQIKCDAVYDPLTFVINGQEYNVTSAALTIDVGLDNNWCMFGVQGVDGYSEQWDLGAPLLRQFCVSFDLTAEKIGLAPVNSLSN